MRAERTHKLEPMQYEFILTDLESLIAALQIVSWEFLNQDVEIGSELDKVRKAIVAIADALEARVKLV